MDFLFSENEVSMGTCGPWCSPNGPIGTFLEAHIPLLENLCIPGFQCAKTLRIYNFLPLVTNCGFGKGKSLLYGLSNLDF